MGPVPLTVPSSISQHPSHKLVSGAMGRARGFSAPGSFTPLGQGGAAGWNTSYPRSALPPLMVPSDPPHLSHHQNNMYSQSSHTLASSDNPPSTNFNPLSYNSSSTRDMVVPSSQQYSYAPEQNNWTYNSTSSHNSSLSSLLNPSSNGYSRPTPTINTTYGSPFSSMPMQGEHSASSLSPDSRPNTGYSMSSVSSAMSYQDDYSRPSSSHHRPISPVRPNSSKSNYNNGPGSLRVGRSRRHSQAMSPYPSPYDHNEQQRPSTSPQPIDDHQSNGIPRIRSMIQLPSVDPYSFSNSQAEFAYSAIPGAVGHTASLDSMNDASGWGQRNVRPSTSTSSISAASHTSSSQANTPPVPDNYNGETDINRCKFSCDFRSGLSISYYQISTWRIQIRHERRAFFMLNFCLHLLPADYRRIFRSICQSLISLVALLLTCLLISFQPPVSPDFGFVPMNEHLPHHHYNKAPGDL